MQTMSISAMISSSPIAAVISNPRLPDNPIVECNDAFVTLTGYSREDIIGVQGDGGGICRKTVGTNRHSIVARLSEGRAPFTQTCHRIALLVCGLTLDFARGEILSLRAIMQWPAWGASRDAR